MSDQTNASIQHDAVDSSAVTTTAKPSHRVIESGSAHHATREQDLANDRLLLGLGDAHEDYMILHPGSYLVSHHSVHNGPEESMLPYMPLRLPEASAAGNMTLSTISQSGTSLSIPYRTESDFQSSWSYEFSWQDEGLCFGGEPLNVHRTPDDGLSKVNPGSEPDFTQLNEPATERASLGALPDAVFSMSIAGIGGYIDYLDSRMLPDNFEVASTMSSVPDSTSSSSGTTDNDATSEPSDPQLVIAMQECADWAVELLIDDFLRSCAPQASKGRATGASQSIIEHTSDHRTGTSRRLNWKASSKSKSRKRNVVDSDDDRSEDEDSNGKKRKASDVEPVQNRRHLACPFIKWDPEAYSDCIKIHPTQFRSIMYHVKKTHWKEHCSICWSICLTDQQKLKHEICKQKRVLRPDPPAGFITEEMRQEIESIGKNVCRGLSHEEKWHKLYSVLFPGAPRCLNPYVSDEANDFMDRAEAHFRGESAQQLLLRVLSERGFKGILRKRVVEMVYGGFLPGVFQEYGRRLTPCESQPLEITHSGQIEADSTDGTITDPDRPSSPSHSETRISYQFPKSESVKVSISDPQPYVTGQNFQNDIPNSFIDPRVLENLPGNSNLDGSEAPLETPDRPLHENFEIAYHSRPGTEEDYEENILFTW
ncbi:hypothetical protein FLONG3_9415 [Fusarium longipes]|uniref:Uncharacterized protein n=1 Tax=Fusarium longipes TaxID=694270 RepID=A0A395RXU1_9HYPO|nr:hypothetical protein FLONG3_9415 [Fusarium longipes]